MRDSQHDISTVSAILPGVYSDDPATNITIDRAGFESVTFAIQIGTGGITFTTTNRIDFIMEHSDDGTVWEGVGPRNMIPVQPVDLSSVTPTGIVLRQNRAHPDPTTHRYGYVDGYVGERRYVRLRADFNGTHATGTPIAAIAILGDPREMPVAA